MNFDIKEEYSIDENYALPLFHNDNELFKDEDDIIEKVITVKRVNTSKKIEDWKILEGKETVKILKGYRFTKKQREFFRSLNGSRFILEGYKQGWKSVNKFKEELKKNDFKEELKKNDHI